MQNGRESTIPMLSRTHVLKPEAMNVTTKFLKYTCKVYSCILWVAVLAYYGIFQFIGDYITAVINFNIQYLCYNVH